MRRRLIALALLVALAGCSGSPATTIRVELSYDEAWGLSGLEVEAKDRRAHSQVAPVVTLLVPDDWADRTTDITLWGMRGDRRWAFGHVQASPVQGAEVTAQATLALLPCGAWCTAGAYSCEGDATVVCEQRDPDTCQEWSEPTPCPGDAPFCSDGVCSASCIDECADGEVRCDGPEGLRACGRTDSDGCRDWGPFVACGDGTTCANGACNAACADDCTVGDVRCFGSAIITCGDANHDGCSEWGPPVPCGNGESCSTGACSAICQNECTTSACDGNLFRECGQFDADPCKELSPGTSCVPPDPCQEGLCTATGCMIAPRVCMEPPQSECVDPGTLRVYDAQGTCQAGGCNYPYHDTNCPGCPACADPCEGVSCTSPPEATCVTASTLRTYQSPGACGGGTCQYPYTDLNCAGGCSGTTCVCVMKMCGAGDCGAMSDGCNGVLQCGGCDGNTFCGADGTANACTTAVVSIETVNNEHGDCPAGYRSIDQCLCADYGCGSEEICLADGVPDDKYELKNLDLGAWCSPGYHEVYSNYCNFYSPLVCVADE